MPNEFKCFRKIFPRFYALAVSEILANPRLIEKSFAWKFIFINLLPALEHHSSQQNEKWVGLFAKYSQILVFIESAVLSIIFQIVGFEGISLFQKANNHLRRVSDVTNLLGGNWSHATNFLDISFKTFLKRMNWVNCWIEVWMIVFFLCIWLVSNGFPIYIVDVWKVFREAWSVATSCLDLFSAVID